MNINGANIFKTKKGLIVKIKKDSVKNNVDDYSNSMNGWTIINNMIIYKQSITNEYILFIKNEENKNNKDIKDNIINNWYINELQYINNKINYYHKKNLELIELEIKQKNNTPNLLSDIIKLDKKRIKYNNLLSKTNNFIKIKKYNSKLSNINKK